jgi:hypothetical protein
MSPISLGWFFAVLLFCLFFLIVLNLIDDKNTGIEDFRTMTVIAIIAGIFAGLIPLAIGLAVQDERDWRQWSSAHHCRMIGRTGPTAAFGPSVSADGRIGTTMLVTGGKTGWLCDDNVTYWR